MSSKRALLTFIEREYAFPHNVVDLTEREFSVFESVEQIAFFFVDKQKPIFGFLLRFGLQRRVGVPWKLLAAVPDARHGVYTIL